MIYLSSLLLLIGGLIPLLISFKLIKAKKHVYLLGWLAWVIGVSIKALLSYLLTSISKDLFSFGPFLVFSTLIESTEVISAYLFLKYHKNLKGVRSIKQLIAFGIGFGSGEAITLAAAAMIPVNMAFSLIDLTVIMERLSAVMIHAATALLIGYFIINKRKINALLALVCKDLSALITVYAFPLLSTNLLYTGVLLFELIIMAYAFFWLAFAYWLGLKQKIKEPKTKHEENYLFNWNKCLMFVGLFMVSSILSSLLINPLTTPFMPASIIINSIITLVLLIKYKGLNDELLTGSFIGFIVFVISTFSRLPAELLELIATQSLLGMPLLLFSGVLIGFIIKTKILESNYLKKKLKI